MNFKLFCCAVGALFNSVHELPDDEQKMALPAVLARKDFHVSESHLVSQDGVWGDHPEVRVSCLAQGVDQGGGVQVHRLPTS